jgi:hypothetical protein
MRHDPDILRWFPYPCRLPHGCDATSSFQMQHGVFAGRADDPHHPATRTSRLPVADHPAREACSRIAGCLITA